MHDWAVIERCSINTCNSPTLALMSSYFMDSSGLDVDQDALQIITLDSTGHTERSTSIHCILVYNIMNMPSG